jgi:hypothetical protein
MEDANPISRRHTLQAASVAGASALLGSARGKAGGASDRTPDDVITNGRVRPEIAERVFKTPLIDTHEHLLEGVLSAVVHEVFLRDRYLPR